MAFFRDSFATALLTNHRDGMAIYTEARRAGFHVSVCSVIDSLPAGSTQQNLGGGDFLVVHAVLSGQDHALAVRVTEVPHDSLVAWQKEFMRGTAAITGSGAITLEPSLVNAELLRCLTTPRSHP